MSNDWWGMGSVARQDDYVMPEGGIPKIIVRPPWSGFPEGPGGGSSREDDELIAYLNAIAPAPRRAPPEPIQPSVYDTQGFTFRAPKAPPRTEAGGPAEARSYEPTTRERGAQRIRGEDTGLVGAARERAAKLLMGTTGLGESGVGLVDAVPGLGSFLGVEDALRGGDYANAAAGAMPGGRMRPRGANALQKAVEGATAPVERNVGFAPGSTFASPETINAAAAESAKGITQPELRTLYESLGLTGREPSSLVRTSIGAEHPASTIKAATELKLADRALLDTLTAEQRKTYQVKNKLPPGLMLPSQEVAAPGLAAFKPIKKEITRAEQAFDEATEAGRPPSSLFDVSPQTLKQTPDVPQFYLPRVPPKQTERLEPVSRGGIQRLERAANDAPEANWGWYNLMQARDMMISIHGPRKGPQVFEAWLDSLAGTSMLNPIDNNIRSSTWYLQQVLQGKPLPKVIAIPDPQTGKTVQTMAGGPPAGYGAKSQIQHADRVQEYMTHSYDPVANPKPISYRTNLSGNWLPRTVDTHDIRNMVGMPYAKTAFGENSSLLPGEYSYLESVGHRAADRAKTSQAPQQAATWVGGGEYTGLKSYPAPLLEALNRRAQVTAQVYGITPEQALHDAFTGRRALLGIGGAAAVAPGVMGSIADQDNY